jgi:RHS repeat-associated protein
MMMPARQVVGSGYWAGFNGKMNDNEVKGVEGTQQDYRMRIYDPRLGRFLSVDPISKEYPELTPYQFASNSPIANIDLDGEEAKYYDVYSYEFRDSKNRLQVQYTKTIETKPTLMAKIANGLKSIAGERKTGELYTFTKSVERINNEGKVVRQSEILYETYIPGENDSQKGGIYLVSKKGGYQHSNGSLSDADLVPISIDFLVDAIGGFPKGNSSGFSRDYSGGEIEKASKLMDVLKSDKKALEKMDKVMSNIKAVLKTEGSGEKIGKAVNKILEMLGNESKGKPIGITCDLPGCQGRIIPLDSASVHLGKIDTVYETKNK